MPAPAPAPAAPTAPAPEATPLQSLASRLEPAARKRLIALLGRGALSRARALQVEAAAAAATASAVADKADPAGSAAPAAAPLCVTRAGARSAFGRVRRA